MYTKFVVSFGAHRIPGGLEAILGPSGCSDVSVKIDEWDFQGIHKIDVDLELDDGDPRIPKLLETLQAYGEGDSYRRKDVYTEDDLQAARLLVMAARQEVTVFGGQGFRETEYDMSNACDTCGTGVRQTSPLLIEASGVSKIKGFLAAATCYFDFFVKDKMVKRLDKAGVTGFTLQDVYSRRKNGETITLPRKQIVANHILPPMHPSASLERKKVCPMCQRGGFSFLGENPVRFVYRAQDVADIADINVTWEWFGETKRTSSSTGVRFSYPRMLVTPKVMNIFRDAVGPDVFLWFPIHVLDE